MSIKPTTLPFGRFLLKLYDPDEEKWTAPCGLTSKGLERSVSTNDTIVPYCDDPDAVAETERTKDAKSSQFTGSGVLDMHYRDVWERFYQDEDSWLVRIYLDTTLANHGGYYQGNFHLTQATFSAERGQKINLAVTLMSDGAVPWVDAEA